MIVGEEAVAVDLVEIGEQALDVIERMRALGVARQLHAIPTGIARGAGGVIRDVSHCGRSRQLARTSIASAPQMRETSAQNSLSGRTLTVTSRITEKSRGFSRRRRTSVSPGLARNRFWSAAAQSAERRAVHRNLDRDQRRQIHAGDFERHDLLHGNLGRGVFLGQHQAADEHRFVFVQRRVQALVLRRKHHGFDGAFQVLDLHRGPRLAFARALADDRGENAAQRDFGAFREAFEIRCGVRGELGHLVFVLIERMAGDVETQHLFFAGEFLGAGPVGDFGKRVLGGGLLRGEHGEQTGLAAGAILPDARAVFHGAIDHGHELRAGAFERIHGAGLDEAFDHAAVDGAQIDALAEIVERSEGAGFGAGFRDGLDRVRADVLDRAEAEADAFVGSGNDGREVEIGGIDVGREHADAHFAALVDVLDHLRGVAGFRGQQRGHELDGIVRLQIRR